MKRGFFQFKIAFRGQWHGFTSFIHRSVQSNYFLNLLKILEKSWKIIDIAEMLEPCIWSPVRTLVVQNTFMFSDSRRLNPVLLPTGLIIETCYHACICVYTCSWNARELEVNMTYILKWQPFKLIYLFGSLPNMVKLPIWLSCVSVMGLHTQKELCSCGQYS